MHSPLVRILEILLFTLVNSIPYHLCAIYPFRKELRFSPPVVVAILALATGVELAFNELVGFGIIESNSFVNWAWSMAYLLSVPDSGSFKYLQFQYCGHQRNRKSPFPPICCRTLPFHRHHHYAGRPACGGRTFLFLY